MPVSPRQQERGWVLVVAMIVMALMLSLGLAAYAYVDQQSRESGKERTREAAFNLAEGALTSQLYKLSRQWPAENAYPGQCDETSTDSRCPTPAEIAARFTQVDFTGTGANAMHWSTIVIDDFEGTLSGQPVNLKNFYQDADGLAVRDSGATYDQNGNGQVWVRAKGQARGKTRILVARVRIESVPVQFPTATLTAGRIHVITNGNGNGGINTCPTMPFNSQPPIVCTADESGTIAPINVRCQSLTYSSATKDAHDWNNGGSHCLDWATGQVAPLGVPGAFCSPQGNPNSADGCGKYTGPDSTISSEALDALRDTAIATNTYCSADGTSNPTLCSTSGADIGCPIKSALTDPTVIPVPTDPNKAGPTVFIEQTPSSGCSYQGNQGDVVFTHAHPGQIIIANGPAACSGASSPAFNIDGSFIIEGLVYSANLQGWSNDPLPCHTPSPANISVRGNARIVGSAATDADGLIELNANANNVRYNSSAVLDATAFGTAGIIQNTWRELQ